MNRNFKIIAVILLVFFIGLFYFVYKGQPSNSLENPELSIGQNKIMIEVVDTPEERALGLGNRSSLPENHGMLFVFDHSDRYGFWMKDTLIALDMIWIDQNKTIVDIKNNVLPSSFPTVYYPSNKALYVLELNAGYAENHGIKIGDKVSF